MFVLYIFDFLTINNLKNHIISSHYNHDISLQLTSSVSVKFCQNVKNKKRYSVTILLFLSHFNSDSTLVTSLKASLKTI
jgi:hypothetical protein